MALAHITACGDVAPQVSISLSPSHQVGDNTCLGLGIIPPEAAYYNSTFCIAVLCDFLFYHNITGDAIIVTKELNIKLKLRLLRHPS